MEISRPSTPPVPAAPQAPTTARPLLQAGETLQALVKSLTADGLAKLQIGRQELLAQTQANLRTGQTLTLLVERAETPAILRLVAPPSADAVKADALRIVLPRMLALAPALQSLLEIAAPRRDLPVSPETRQLVRELVGALPTATGAASAEGLRLALLQSGLLSESRLVRDAAPVQDLKAALLRVAARLRADSESAGRPGPGTTGRGQAAGGGREGPGTGAAGTHTAPTRTPSDTAAPTRPGSMGTAATAGTPDRSANPRPGMASATAPGTTQGTTPGPRPAPALPTEVRPDAGAKPGTAPRPELPPAAREPAGRPAPETGARAPALPLPPGPSPTARPALLLPPLAGSPTATGALPPVPTDGLPRAPLPGAVTRPVAQAAGPRPDAPPPPGPIGERQLRELSRQVEGALSRIRYNQLASVPQEDGKPLVWQLDLPLRDGEHLDAFHIRLEEERRERRKPGRAGWRLSLDFDLAPLGPVHLRLGLYGQNVSALFWAERADTAALIGRRLGELQAGFERAGLTVERLMAQAGRPPASAEPPATTSPLLDEQA